VTEVSQVRKNCLIELKYLEDSACLPGMYSSGVVVHQIKTEHDQFKDKVKERGVLLCELEVSVDSRHQNWLYNKYNTTKN
jgi:hypothetical protein